MRRRGALLLALALAPLSAAAAAAAGPDAQAVARGRTIYLEGASPSGGEIVAVMSEAGVEVPAAAVPCGGCHGRDGKGNPEGGVSPSDLTWTALTRPYGVTHPSGRRHPPYDVKRLKRAIALGVDPAGQPLHVAMPRYRMSLKDMEDLLAYLRQLGEGSDPGVSDTAVRIGVVLPPAGPLSGMSDAVRAALTARFEAVNRDGGLYGRRIEPRFLEAPAEAGQRRGWTDDFLQREEIFAGVASFFAGADGEMAALFRERQVPMVGPFALDPREESPLNRYVFHLLPGLATQERALAAFAARAGWPRPAALTGGVEELRRMAADGADPVAFAGSGPEALVLLQAADRLGWHPRVLATAAAADGSLLAAPAAFEGKIYLALPTSPESAALAAAEVLIEALKRAGRDLDRETLVARLESLRELATGHGPPVTFGPGRRLGARGSRIVRLDLAARRAADAGWSAAD